MNSGDSPGGGVGGARKWVKVWVDRWLNGTVRFTLDHRERAVWIDLLTLAGQSRIPGAICAGTEGGAIVGLPLLRLAGIVDVPENDLLAMLEKFRKQDRLTFENDEGGRYIIRILNWSTYQADYSKQARYKAKKKRAGRRSPSGTE